MLSRWSGSVDEKLPCASNEQVSWVSNEQVPCVSKVCPGLKRCGHLTTSLASQCKLVWNVSWWSASILEEQKSAHLDTEDGRLTLQKLTNAKARQTLPSATRLSWIRGPVALRHQIALVLPLSETFIWVGLLGSSVEKMRILINYYQWPITGIMLIILPSVKFFVICLYFTYA